MKYVLLLISLTLILSSGMTTAEKDADIAGTWVTTEGMVAGFTGEITNLTPHGDIWNLTQQDRIIIGTNSFQLGDEQIVENLTGIISPDGKTVNIVDKNGGLYLGTLNVDNTLSVSYLNTGEIRDKEGYGLALSMTMEKKTG
ncbi:MAG: hypothetical protein LUQ50_14420 [Methanospirillum sp.]|uniref:hypothetical protein n=1 Tax=Methanospirillum sp. TaxID=45200 RepID=UPI002375789D|nr:hypothetical protein [Methanospirillum sp.]MDD1730249.1 hypothetical protein [Methanospirillum sp.]